MTLIWRSMPRTAQRGYVVAISAFLSVASVGCGKADASTEVDGAGPDAGFVRGDGGGPAPSDGGTVSRDGDASRGSTPDGRAPDGRAPDGAASPADSAVSDGPHGTTNQCAQFVQDSGAGLVGGSDPGDPPCTGDWGTDASAPCPSRSPGFCSTEGICTQCVDCNAAPGHPGTVCSIEGLCGPPCPAGGCPTGQYCSSGDAGACVPKFVSDGQPLEPPESATACASAAYKCLSGVTSVGVSGLGNTYGNCFCGKPNGADCTQDSECTYGLCAADGKCAGLVGAACDPTKATSANLYSRSYCRSDNCDHATCTCDSLCQSDSDCGDAGSGTVCDPVQGICVPGCRGTGNGCPPTESCTSDGGVIGTCTSPCGPGCVAANGVCRNGVCTITCGLSECHGTITCDSCVIDCEGMSSCQGLHVVASDSATVNCTGSASCEQLSCSGASCTASCSGAAAGCGQFGCDAGTCSGNF